MAFFQVFQCFSYKKGIVQPLPSNFKEDDFVALCCEGSQISCQGSSSFRSMLSPPSLIVSGQAWQWSRNRWHSNDEWKARQRSAERSPLGADRTCKFIIMKGHVYFTIRDCKTLHRDWSAISSRWRQNICCIRIGHCNRKFLYGMMITCLLYCIWVRLDIVFKSDRQQQKRIRTTELKVQQSRSLQFSNHVDEIRYWFAIDPRFPRDCETRLSRPWLMPCLEIL